MELKGKGIAVEYLSPTQTLEIRQKIFKDLSSEELSLRLHYVPPELIATTRGLLNLIVKTDKALS